MIKQEFRYVKKEKLAGLWGILVGIVFLFFGVYDPRTRHFAVHTASLFLVIYYMSCFILMIYFFHLWLRRHGFVITVDSIGLRISRFDKTQKINWESVKSYTYQCGHPYWFLSLHLTNGKRINLHGELENFDDLIRVIKEKVKCSANEFQYTMRRRMNIFVSVILLFINILVTSISLIDTIAGRILWIDALGIAGLFLLFSLGAVFDLFGKGHAQLFVTKEGIIMKSWLGRRIFIPWFEIRDHSQLKLINAMLTIIKKGWKLTIKTKNKSVPFYEDLDNVDELINIIEDKTGIKLNL